MEENDNSEEGDQIRALLKGTLATYVPVYLGNNMLFWSGEYWESSHPIPSSRIKSQDLVDTDLKTGLKRLLVHSR